MKLTLTISHYTLSQAINGPFPFAFFKERKIPTFQTKFSFKTQSTELSKTSTITPALIRLLNNKLECMRSLETTLE